MCIILINFLLLLTSVRDDSKPTPKKECTQVGVHKATNITSQTVSIVLRTF